MESKYCLHWVSHGGLSCAAMSRGLYSSLPHSMYMRADDRMTGGDCQGRTRTTHPRAQAHGTESPLSRKDQSVPYRPCTVHMYRGLQPAREGWTAVLPCPALSPTASGWVETWRHTKASRQMNEAPECQVEEVKVYVTITASAS